MPKKKSKYKFLNELDNRGKPEHLHMFGDSPLIGTSTALKVLDKPGLTWWASGMAVKKFGWIKKLDTRKSTKEEVEKNKIERLNSATKKLNEIQFMESEEFLSLLDEAYKAHQTTLKEKADDGTDMHAELEKYVKLCISSNAIVEANSEHVAVVRFADWSKSNVDHFVASEAHCFSKKLHTGGIVDALYVDKGGRLVVLDFKSSKEAYFTHFLQDAGYDIAISENGVFDEEGNLQFKLERSIDYYGVFPFGMENPEPQFYFDIEKAKRGFKLTVELYKLINNT